MRRSKVLEGVPIPAEYRKGKDRKMKEIKGWGIRSEQENKMSKVKDLEHTGGVEGSISIYSKYKVSDTESRRIPL